MLLFACIFAAAYYAKSLAPLPVDKIVLLKKATDDRGYISIQYKVGRDTFAYDYLTPHEYSVFIKSGNPFTDVY